MNISAAQMILQKAHAIGVRDVCVCAGARNSPLVALLGATTSLSSLSFFDERAAAFFALGRARRDRRPVAVVTTSGTAVAELLPAVIEAFYTGVPLLLITADRPRRLRGTGAPQSMVQPGLFGEHVQWAVDWEASEIAKSVHHLQEWRQQAPAHLNICFDEPLLDAPVMPWQTKTEAARDVLPLTEPTQGLRAVVEFQKQVQKPLAIVGTLASVEEQQAVLLLLQNWQIPVYLEGPSGLRGHTALAAQEVFSGESFLNWSLQKKLFDGVVRLGSVPTARLWRDLETSDTPVLSLSATPFAGLSHGVLCAGDLVTLCASACGGVRAQPNSELLTVDRQKARELQVLLEQEPLSEPAWMQRLSQWCRPHETVYVGNSLPIREWDLAATRAQALWVHANRGVNGIDGQLSTFFGLADTGKHQLAILGDLTTLYDLSAPWVLTQLPATDWQVAIINNSGGQIFKQIFQKPLFINEHSLQFADWARMWNLSYERIEKIESQRPVARVLEIVPDANATARFWEMYKSLWTKL